MFDNDTHQDISPYDVAHSELMSYVKLQYPSYILGKHQIYTAQALKALESGEITRLIICEPPRHGKSMLASEFFPAWFLGRNPSLQIIATTYSHEKAGDSGRKVRNLMVSDIHGKVFPGCQVSPDNKGANRLSTLTGGNLFSVGVGGAITGRGADLLLIDDPIKNREEAESETAQRRLRDWFTSVAYTRLMPGGRILLIMTRWHFYDLAGYLLQEKAHEGWVVINLPAIAEFDDQLGRQPGQALWPERYSLDVLENIKSTVGTRDWGSLYQQSPVPEEGGMIKLNWFQRYKWNDLLATRTACRMGAKIEKTPLPFKRIICSWDTAFKEKELNDPSSCTVWGLLENDFYLIDVINERMEFPKLERKVQMVHKRMQHDFRMPSGKIPVLIEDKASGQSLIQSLKRNTKLPIIAIKADANKQIRFSEVTPFIESGRVFLPDRAPWLVDYETQLFRFPFDKHDDMVDSTSQFLRWQGKPRFISRGLKYWK